MGSYPCSNCGATADTSSGCPSCGRSFEAEIGSMDQTILSMQRRTKSMAEDRSAVMARLQGAITTRALLLRAAGGARTDEQLADNLKAADLILTDDDRQRLDAVSAPPLLYPYWHQAKTASDRLSPADLSLLGPHLTD